MVKLYKTLLMPAFFVGIVSCQDYTYHDTIAIDKSQVISRNCILISSDTPANIRVSYYKTNNGKTNELVTKELVTPCVLNLENVVVKYDSLNFMLGPVKRLIRGKIIFKHDFKEGGAEYFKLENLSDKTIKFAVIGTQELQIRDRFSERRVKEIIDNPKPIYKGVPVLYLLYPDRAPEKQLDYFAIEEYKFNGKSVSIGKTSFKKIDLYSNKLGEFNSNELPFSIDRIISIYENNEQELFFEYVNYSLSLIGVKSDTDKMALELKNKNMKLFHTVAPHNTLINHGAVPLALNSFDEKCYWE